MLERGCYTIEDTAFLKGVANGTASEVNPCASAGPMNLFIKC